jgi:hypothetical protein
VMRTMSLRVGVLFWCLFKFYLWKLL